MAYLPNDIVLGSCLPVELYRPMIEAIFKEYHHNYNTLCILARVSRTWQCEAERLIYSTCKFEGLADIIIMCRRICSSPRLGPHIRIFDGGAIERGHHYDAMGHNLNRLLSRTLQLMTELRTLILPSFYPAVERSSCKSIFTSSTFKLRVLSTFFQPDEHILRFLETQPDIYRWEGKGLHLNGFLPRKPLPTHVLANLKVLHANSPSTEALNVLPGRSVTHLAVDNVVTLAQLRWISLYGANLRALNLNQGCIGTSIEIVKQIPDMFPHLEVFCGVVISTQTAATIFEPLAKLIHLHSVSFKYPDWDWNNTIMRQFTGSVRIAHMSVPSGRTVKTYVWKSDPWKIIRIFTTGMSLWDIAVVETDVKIAW